MVRVRVVKGLGLRVEVMVETRIDTRVDMRVRFTFDSYGLREGLCVEGWEKITG